AARHGPLREVRAGRDVERRVRFGRRSGAVRLAARLLALPPRQGGRALPGDAVHGLPVRHAGASAARVEDVRGAAARDRRRRADPAAQRDRGGSRRPVGQPLGRSGGRHADVHGRATRSIVERMSGRGLTMTGAAPDPAVRPFVRRLCAYREDHGRPLTRAESAETGAVLILGFGGPMEVGDQRLTSFAAGPSDRFMLTRMTVPTEGVQVELTPFGARRLFGMPLGQVVNLAVPAGELLGPWAQEAARRLAETPSHAERLALAERLIAGRIASGPEPDPEVRWAWARLLESGGAVPVSSLAASLGRSHRHLVSRFRDQVGLTPKAAARVIRF